MSKKNVTIRMDEETKRECEALYWDLGLTLSAAINVFMKASIKAGGFPFEVKHPLPNKETIEAIQEAERMLKDPNTKYYDNMDDIKKALMSDE